MWPLLGHTPQMRLSDEAPVLEPLWSCWEQDSCPRAGRKGWDFFLGSRLGSRKPLPAQISPVLSGAHLLRCLRDCTSNILGEKSHESCFPAPSLKKPAGKKLQQRKEEELLRRAWQGLPVGKLEGAPA